MREVAVHLEHELGAVRQRTPEPGEVRRPQPLLALTVQDVDVVELRSEAIGKVAGTVRRAVVDDEHVHALVPERAKHRLEVLELVVRGEADDGFRHLRIFTLVMAERTLQLSGAAVRATVRSRYV